MGPIITPRPTLGSYGLKYVADVEFTGIEDAPGVIQHDLSINPAPPNSPKCLNPIVIVDVLAMGADTRQLIEIFGTDATGNSFEVDINGRI